MNLRLAGVANVHLEDIDIARRLAAGDRTVLDELFVNLWPVIAWRIKCRFPRLFSAADVDDLGQESFLRVWRNRAKYNPDRGSVASWVSSIALNLARDAARRHAGKQRGSDHGAEPVTLESLLSAAPQLELDASDAHEDVVRLREALAELTERQRAILMAQYAGNGDPPTSRELAAEFRITPAAVRMDLSRAKAKIRAYFQAAKGGKPRKPRNGGRGG